MRRREFLALGTLLGLSAAAPAAGAQSPGVAPTVPAKAVAKVRVGVLKLTSSAQILLGLEHGYFREAGIEPELVFFQAAQPVAVALAAGEIEVGATGPTAALYNIVAGGKQLWVVADKGASGPATRSGLSSSTRTTRSRRSRICAARRSASPRSAPPSTTCWGTCWSRRSSP